MVSCNQLTSLTDQPKVCCVYEYDADGVERPGLATCLKIPAEIGEAACTANRTIILPNRNPLTVPNGKIEECCRDCNPPPMVLTVSGGRLVRNGATLRRSPAQEPEKCCCGDDCTCEKVPEANGQACEQVRCYPKTNPDLDEKCKARCVIKTYDDSSVEKKADRQIICATVTQCCAEDNSTCEPTCADVTDPAGHFRPIPAANSWTQMPCTTCGVCCVNNYDDDPASPTYRTPLSKTGTRDITQAECEALSVFIFPDPTLLKYGDWHPNTDNVNICNPDCCRTVILGNEKLAECGKSSLTECDPCKGRCVDVTRELSTNLCPQTECKTKQECCGEGNEKCTPQCGELNPRYRWEEMSCSDGDKCGKCCQNIWDDETAPGNMVPLDVICNSTVTNKTECERYISLPSGVNRPYGVWHPFSTCAVCKSVRCCRPVQCANGTTKTTCVEVAPEDCNLCNGTCTELATNNQSCATRFSCCGPDDMFCRPICGSLPTHRWEVGCADPYKCGVCCRVEYAVDAITREKTYLSHICYDKESDPNPYPTRQTCVLTAAEAATIPADRAIVYSWRAFAASCSEINCATKKCCGEICPGDVGCIDINADAPCDPCKGRCEALLPDGTRDPNQPTTCQTKQQCCGVDGALCRGCPAPGPGPAFRWDGCFDNGFLCGVCCQLTLNSSGVPVSSTCLDDVTYDECLALPNASWKAFETCASAICIPRTCCNDQICPGQTVCVPVDKTRGACPDFCRDECYAINADGEQTGDAFCALKVDCCGEFDERCVPKPGLCPGETTIPTHSWNNDCADPALCGVCCKRNVGTNGAITFSCDATKTNHAECTAANYGVWYSFATCAVCGPTKQACVEARCRKILNINGDDVEVMYTNATCQPVAPDKTTCKGICTEFATENKPYAETTCKTKKECCGVDNAKCGPGCASETATHAWVSACTDPDQCGVCCITNNMGGGNVTASCQDQAGITRATCEALNTANGGLGNTAVWVPFGLCRDCSIQRCCGTCPDGSVACKDVIPPEICLQPCNGKCTTLLANGATDPNNPPFCATKATCCMQNGVNICANNCLPGRRWEPTCPENSVKCGVACKTTYNGTTILGAECVPGITTFAQYQAAQANLAPNETLTWKPWDTCETVICLSKKCCGEKCPGVLGCIDVDISDPCERCEGLCYDAVVDPNTGAHSIAPGAVPECSMRADCCGAGNEYCAEIANCPQERAKVFVPCCADDVFQACQCGGADGGPPNSYSFNSGVVQVPPVLPGFPNGYKMESCSSRIDGYLSGDFAGRLQSKLWNTGGWGNVPRESSTTTVANPCTGEGGVIPTFSWKDCYPGLIDSSTPFGIGNVIYVFSQQRSAYQTVASSSGQGTPFAPAGEEYFHNVFNQKFTFYICQGKKLIDVTDAIINKLGVKGCKFTEKTYERRCVNEFIAFSAADYEALGASGNPPSGYELTPFGAPGYYFTGFYTFGYYAYTGVRIRRFDSWYNDIVTGNLNLPPMASDVYDRWGNKVFSQGDPRPIYSWTAGSNVSGTVCDIWLPNAGHPQPPVPPTTGTYEVVDIPDPFNNFSCSNMTVDYFGDPPQPGQPIVLGPNFVPPVVAADCCAIYETSIVRAAEGNSDNALGHVCEHDWDVSCGQFLDNGLPNDTPVNCPQNFTQNPLP